MTDELAKWLVSAELTCEKAGWVSDHIDSILTLDRLSGLGAIRESVSALGSILSNVDRSKVVCSLHVALRPALRLLRIPPSLDAAATRALWEPPSLYLQTVSHHGMMSGFEEYRRPVDHLGLDVPDGVEVYYRVFRDEATNPDYFRYFVFEDFHRFK